MFPQYKVSVNILIQNGELRQLGGSVDGLDIPVFAGVFLNEVHFQIVTDPLTLSGGARLTALAGALTGELDMVIRTKPVFLRLEGRIAVASIPLAEAYVQYDEANHSTVSFGGHLGIDFGPVSMNPDLKPSRPPTSPDRTRFRQSSTSRRPGLAGGIRRCRSGRSWSVRTSLRRCRRRLSHASTSTATGRAGCSWTSHQAAPAR